MWFIISLPSIKPTTGCLHADASVLKVIRIANLFFAEVHHSTSLFLLAMHSSIRNSLQMEQYPVLLANYQISDLNRSFVKVRAKSITNVAWEYSLSEDQFVHHFTSIAISQLCANWKQSEASERRRSGHSACLPRKYHPRVRMNQDEGPFSEQWLAIVRLHVELCFNSFYHHVHLSLGLYYPGLCANAVLKRLMWEEGPTHADVNGCIWDSLGPQMHSFYMHTYSVSQQIFWMDTFTNFPLKMWTICHLMAEGIPFTLA